ncbi:MAG: murein L,D-transpeptidase family protein [Hyphomicrobiales bacterium]
MRPGKTIVFIIIAFVAGVMVLAATEPWLLYEGRDRLGRALAPYLPRVPDVVQKPRRPLTERLAARGMSLGAPAFIRIHKAESGLEVWLKKGPRFELFETFEICRWSGAAGPKLREGDGQAPEGFYPVTRRQLNPNSAHHLAFNLGYPNAFDRANGRTGSALMVHGGCSSIGCYAMTDRGLDDIYAIVESALVAGQRAVPVLALPFRMTGEALAAHAGEAWSEFWGDLAAADALFEQHRLPPAASVCGRRYVFGARPGPGCRPISGW